MIVSQLCQKPKLGGRYAYTDRPLIYTFVSCQFLVYPCFAFSCLFLLVLFIFLKPKIPKIFLLFLFALFQFNSKLWFWCCFSFRAVVLFCLFDFRIAFQKPKNIFLFHLFLPCFVSKSKTPKIFVVLLGFVQFFSDSTAVCDSTWSLVFILYHSSYASERQ